MGYFPTIFGVCVLIGIAVFFWRREGPGSGRAFGNRVAAHIGLPRKLFWPLLENGVKGSSRALLAGLQKDGVGLDEASAQVVPWLARGLERLEARFGPQDMYAPARQRLAALLPGEGAPPAAGLTDR